MLDNDIAVEPPILAGPTGWGPHLHAWLHQRAHLGVAALTSGGEGAHVCPTVSEPEAPHRGGGHTAGAGARAAQQDLIALWEAMAPCDPSMMSSSGVETMYTLGRQVVRFMVGLDPSAIGHLLIYISIINVALIVQMMTRLGGRVI